MRRHYLAAMAVIVCLKEEAWANQFVVDAPLAGQPAPEDSRPIEVPPRQEAAPAEIRPTRPQSTITLTLPTAVYRGRWGGFNLSGRAGAAAYVFRGLSYRASLSFLSETPQYWLYSTTGGDPFIARWAFPKQPASCGDYWVWRFADDGWKPYEATAATVFKIETLTRTSVDGELSRLQSSVEILIQQQRNLEERVLRLEQEHPHP